MVNLLQCKCYLCGNRIEQGQGTRYLTYTGHDIGSYSCSNCTKQSSYCACGCGELVSIGRKYRQGHVWRLYNKLPEVRESKMGDKNVARRPEVRAKIKQFWRDNPEIKDYCVSCGQAGLEANRDKTSRLNSIRMKGVPLSLSRKEALKQYYKDNPQSPEPHRRLWANKEWRENTIRAILKASHQRPNSLEQKFIDLCVKNNLSYKYVGSGEVIIAGLNPDFINTNSTKQVIEIYGEYWHHDDGSLRTQKFAEIGFECLIIWESEFDNTDKIVEKVRSFTK